MARIRAFENAAEEASRGSVAAFGASLAQSSIRGPLHLSTGQEAVAAGVCANLEKDDYLTSTHRGHGHTLAKGASMDAMMAELFGRTSGPNRGKGGSMHLADFSVGMLGANGVVADQRLSSHTKRIGSAWIAAQFSASRNGPRFTAPSPKKQATT